MATIEMIGINPKYENLIKTKLRDADSYNTFMELVDVAKRDIINLHEIIEREGIRPDVMRGGRVFTPGNTNSDYMWYEMNTDPNNDFDGTMCPHPVPCNRLKDMANGVSAPRLTKYVNTGLMCRGHNELYEYYSAGGNRGASKYQTYYYWLPYDFFTTNDLSIKFSPHKHYECYEYQKTYTF